MKKLLTLTLAGALLAGAAAAVNADELTDLTTAMDALVTETKPATVSTGDADVDALINGIENNDPAVITPAEVTEALNALDTYTQPINGQDGDIDWSLADGITVDGKKEEKSAEVKEATAKAAKAAKADKAASNKSAEKVLPKTSAVK